MGVNTFFQKLVPKDKKFYPMFESQAELIVQATELLNDIYITRNQEKAAMIHKNIKELENKGDDRGRSPAAPRDLPVREARCARTGDSTGAPSRQNRLRPDLGSPVRVLPAEFVQFSGILMKGGGEIRLAVGELHNLKRPDKISQACIRINEMENQADDLYHQVISDLFEHEKDAIELIKKKEVLQTMERASDRMEDVADVLKTIMIKIA